MVGLHGRSSSNERSNRLVIACYRVEVAGLVRTQHLGLALTYYGNRRDGSLTLNRLCPLDGSLNRQLVASCA